MAGLWYRAGTVAVTNASKKVVGTGSTWKSGVSKPDKGHLFWGPDGKPYELDYVESDTVLYLVTAYASATASGMAYAIDITRTSSTPGFSRELSAFVAYHQLQMDGWQQLLTGSGDVTLTAPDGTKMTVPSWEKVMNAGSGVVAQAKIEADRAKTEATKAEASAAAASNAVVAAALPLPDVWAPLSDSLRLVTGYGRDVLVGSDVVARMVSFSRTTAATYIGKDGTLKTAAENEPRFEREGLLIEGQSTNLISNSSARGTNYQGNLIIVESGGGSATISNNVSSPNTSGAIARRVLVFPLSSLLPNTTYTYSVLCTGKHDIGVYGPALTAASSQVSGSVSGIGRSLITFTTNSTGGSCTVELYASDNKDNYSPDTFTLYGIQLEALPFASSYIPTNGAAVTRGADVAQLPALGNMVALGFAVCAEFDTQRAGVSITSENTCLFSMEQVSRARMAVIRGKYGGADADYGFAANCGAYGQAGYVTTVLRDFTVKDRKGVVVISEGGGFLKMRVNSSFSSVSSSTATAAPLPNTIYLGAFGGGGLQALFGHLRNLRIWQRPLTDAQLKAIA
ncbi:TPA: hypothetical protein RVR74_001259 [Aeromonas salmonicida]|nr:hypothetical protein [Aeromonas salmonicida]